MSVQRCSAHFGESDRRCTRDADHSQPLHTIPGEISWPDTLVMRHTVDARLRSGELFAGVGGLGMAVDEVFDAQPSWFCEFDAAPSKVLAHHFPDVPNLGDVRAVKWTPDCPTCGEPTGLLWRRDELSGPVRKEYHCQEHGWWPLDIRLADPDADRIPEPVSVAAGGFPCQDVSLAGRRRGMRDGTRSGLWSEFAKAIDVLRPDWVVIENVRGLLSADAAVDMEPCPLCVGDNPEHVLRALGAVLGDLADLGFDAEWIGLRAADTGAPHGRFRVFILAWPRERTAPHTARVSGGRSADARAEDRRSGSLTLLPTPTVVMNDGESVESWSARRDRVKATGINGNGMGMPLPIAVQLLPTPMVGSSSPAAHGQISGDFRSAMDRVLSEVTLLPTPNVAMAVGGQTSRSGARKDELLLGGLAAEHATDWGPYAPAISRWETVAGRAAPAPVRYDGRGGKPRLNPELTEWMMGWPVGWVTDPEIGLSRGEQLKACGNGVVPQQAAAALRILLARPGVPALAESMAVAS